MRNEETLISTRLYEQIARSLIEFYGLFFKGDINTDVAPADLEPQAVKEAMMMKSKEVKKRWNSWKG